MSDPRDEMGEWPDQSPTIVVVRAPDPPPWMNGSSLAAFGPYFGDDPRTTELALAAHRDGGGVVQVWNLPLQPHPLPSVDSTAILGSDDDRA